MSKRIRMPLGGEMVDVPDIDMIDTMADLLSQILLELQEMNDNLEDIKDLLDKGGGRPPRNR